jgi:hypothetical protein
MPSYAGADFENDVTGQDGMVSRWQREAVFSVRQVPGSDFEDTQYIGRGNERLTVRAYIEDDDDLATLQAAVGATRRTLTNPFGDSVNYSNVILMAVRNVRRLAWEEVIEAELEFMRTGA